MKWKKKKMVYSLEGWFFDHHLMIMLMNRLLVYVKVDHDASIRMASNDG